MFVLIHITITSLISRLEVNKSRMSNLSFNQLEAPKKLDVIAELKFLPNRHALIASSWDRKVLLYDCSRFNQERQVETFIEMKMTSPGLSIAFTKNGSTYVGCLDGSISKIDYENLKQEPTSQSASDCDPVNSGINNLSTIANLEHTLVATSFGGEMSVLDSRTCRKVFQKKLAHKTLKMDSSSQNLIIGLTNRQVELYDYRNWKEPYQIRESGSKYQITDLKCFPNGEGYATASIDGRVAIEYIDPSLESQLKKFAFKCHRVQGPSGEPLVYPVNSLAFHSIYQTLFTAGSDGNIYLWNLNKRKRMKQYPRLSYPSGQPKSITKLCLSDDCNFLAIALSDDSYKNISTLNEYVPLKPSEIYLRPLQSGECKPKG